jgi:hypothetical protein
MAAVAGAITALSLMDWQKMSWQLRAMTVFVGTAFAIFAVPLLVSSIAPFDNMKLKIACGATYFGGTFSNLAIPAIWKWITKKYGLESGEVKG